MGIRKIQQGIKTPNKIWWAGRELAMLAGNKTSMQTLHASKRQFEGIIEDKTPFTPAKNTHAKKYEIPSDENQW